MKIDGSYSVGRCISQFYRSGQSFLAKEFKSYDIGVGQYQFLVQLYIKDGISHDELTDRMCVDKATTTRAVMKLEETGYVKRILDENDKRKYKIYLTEKSLEKKEDILHVFKLWENKLVNNLNKEEQEMLIFLLNKMVENN